MKQCSRCDTIYLIAEGNFPRTKRTKDGYSHWCKSCFADWRAANREYLLEEKRRYHHEHKNDPGYKEKRSQYKKQFVQLNEDRIKESNREYRKANREKRKEYNRGWHEQNPGYRAQYQREWKHRNPGRIKRYYTEEFSYQDWLVCLNYFNGCCAVCGRSPEKRRPLAMDHWHASSKGGTTSADNIIPLCQGLDGCNNIKHARHPLDFLLQRLSSENAKQKLAEIETYFEYIRGRKKDE